MRNIKVSVYCCTYNHEKYIKETLESLINQITDFDYEIIVHDDASTDKTASIIHCYEKLYPNKIKAIYQIKNQYSQKKDIAKNFIYPNVNGTYIAVCEGDDFWTDKYKLQKQVRALEENKECYLCVHRTAEVMENGKYNGVVYPKDECKTGIIQARKFLAMGKNYSFHTSSYMFRAIEWKKYICDLPKFKTESGANGDEALMLFFASLGDIYYIDEIMSCYRRGVESSYSKLLYSGDVYHKLYNKLKAEVKMLELYDTYTNQIYHNICVERKTYALEMTLILEGKARNFFQKDNIDCFFYLNMKQKIKIILAVICPSLIKEITKRNFVKGVMLEAKKKGY